MTIPPHAYPSPPHAGPPARKSRTGLIVALVIGACVLACCGIGGVVAAVGGGTEPAATAEIEAAADSSPAPAAAAKKQPVAKKPAAKKPAKKKLAGIGTPVRDGKFEFIVKSNKCGVARVGNQYVGTSAQGQFCLVTILVKNIGDRAQMFDSSSQKAFNAAGQEYSANGAAGIYANDNNQTFLNEINPGNSSTGTVVFDIPKGGALARAELHDSPFSGGVTVALT